ncbi:MAG TPA: 30S ribosomal protein S7 [Bacteroidota bacterium]|nr:30S ribosomal protein S7 [Bacteroidota bacterium]HRT67514.1 30S ribosomal protein S7 [Bacteroidota bacterium]
MRKKKAEIRRIPPDIRYNDMMVAKLINYIMWDGKKSVATDIVYEAFDIIKDKLKEEPLDVFNRAISNISPIIEVRSRRVGGATYQVPVEVKENRRIALALRWLKTAARARKDKSMSQRLANEIISASKGEGAAFKKKEDVHRMAEANKAFAHFRW